MDEFKTQDHEELKPDTSDRPSSRSRRTTSSLKLPVSRQHIMMVIGIVVLLLLIIGLGSALTGPDKNSDQSKGSQSGNQNAQYAVDKQPEEVTVSALERGSNTASSFGSSALQELAPSQVVSAPETFRNVEADKQQQRVNIEGDLKNSLNRDSESKQQLRNLTQNSREANAATNNVKAPSRQAGLQNQAVKNHASSSTTKNATKTAAPPRQAGQLTSGNYTLQLSSASRSDTLEKWAQQHKLTNYHVYQTSRNGKPWYVLVSGSYATPGDAKRAVAGLPEAVKGQKPWVKPVNQVKKESRN